MGISYFRYVCADQLISVLFIEDFHCCRPALSGDNRSSCACISSKSVKFIYIFPSSKNYITRQLEYMVSGDQWFWPNLLLLFIDSRPNLIFSMCGIKFWKGYEHLRPVYDKPFFEVLSGFLHFWPKNSQKVFIIPSQKWKLFILQIWRMEYQKIRLFLLILKL